jgi:Flp pilus assembly protein TadG
MKLLHPSAILRAGINRIRVAAGADPIDEDASLATQAKEAGQIVVIFALMLVVLIGLVGIAVDTTYAWREALRVQRAADSAALAGVVYLPGNFDRAGGAKDTAWAAAKMNGYADKNAVVVTQGATVRELDVSITSAAPTFFVRIFGINSFTVSRSSKAVYILPVPMGSPQPYYGVAGTYTIGTTTTTMKGPLNETITNPQGFWATMLTQGAGANSGDAYMPTKLNANQTTATPVNPTADTTHYYDYGIQMPAGSTGNVWIFDPVFCSTNGRQGTGEWWLSGTNPVSSYFKLYDTHNQPYVPGAATLVGSSLNFFKDQQYTDSTENDGAVETGTTECKAGVTTNTADPRYWHNKWWNLSAYITANGGTGTISGGAGGELYRLRTTTDPGDATQDSTNGFNDFAIYVEATGSADSATVFGLGAMESFFLLPQSKTSEFYLAQIDQASGRGKTIDISLWDVGDVNNLSSATLQVLAPGASGWTAVSGMSWTASKPSGSTSSAPCPSNSGNTITSYTGGTKQYDGCWLTITIDIGPTYTTYPKPGTDGWWKIRYTTGTGSDYSTDLTTWQVNVRGNPVHLIP